MPNVSVIIPVYNSEKYIEKAIINLMEQTLNNVEYIIIDDGSTDNSLNIIEKILSKYTNEKLVKLISRENKGAAATRQEGVALSTGEYIIHHDSDDWVEKNWLECMYTKAINDNADIVICNYRLIFQKRNMNIYQTGCTDNKECIKLLLSGKISNSNCDKLIKRNLYFDNDISFISGLNMGEDFFVTLRLFFFSKSVSYVPDVLYNYNQTNTNSLTTIYSTKSLNDIIEITHKTEKFLIDNNGYQVYKEDLNKFKLNVRALFITHANGDKKIKKIGLSLYPESDYLIKSNAPKILKIMFFLNKTGLFFLHTIIDYLYFLYIKYKGLSK